MSKQKPIIVRLERLPHRHAVVRVRSAFRQLRRMPVKTKLVDKKKLPYISSCSGEKS